MNGVPRAAAVIEGHENHTRTAAVRIDMERVLDACNYLNSLGEASNPSSLDVTQIHVEGRSTRNPGQEEKVLEVPVTQAVIYGWYDNELGSYTNMLGDRTVSIARQM